jgi:hypothetical protein
MSRTDLDRDRTDDPVPLLHARSTGTAPFLRAYRRSTEAPDTPAAAWRRIEDRLAAPARARPWSTTVCGALVATCLAIWLMVPPRHNPHTSGPGLEAAGGSPGTRAAVGGVEGAGGERDDPRS